MDSVNFVHDVNTLRKTIKSVYSNSADLKALNSELGASLGNCRVQVLPVCWRHLIEFPRRRQRKGEQDLGDNATDEVDQCKAQQDCCITTKNMDAKNLALSQIHRSRILQ